MYVSVFVLSGHISKNNKVRELRYDAFHICILMTHHFLFISSAERTNTRVILKLYISYKYTNYEMGTLKTPSVVKSILAPKELSLRPFEIEPSIVVFIHCA